MAKREHIPTNAANIAAAILTSSILVLMGVLMLLSGLDVLGVDIALFWLPALLIGFGLSQLGTGMLRRSTSLSWCGIVFLACALTVLIEETTAETYARLYPMFIAAPGIASLLIVAFADNKKLHLQSVVLFGGLSAIFAMQSAGVIRNWLVIAGVAVIMIGLFVFVNVITSRRGRWDDGDRPQRPRGKKWDDGDTSASHGGEEHE